MSRGICYPLRSLAINALRLDGIWSITEGIAAPRSRHQRVAQAAGLDRARNRNALGMTSNKPWRLSVQDRVGPLQPDRFAQKREIKG